jgi:hypothetical protein
MSFLRLAGKDTPQPVITQTLKTTTRASHPQSGAAGSLERDNENARTECTGEVQPAREVGNAYGAGGMRFFGMG